MRPYTHRQVLAGPVEYGAPTVISSKVISSQCLAPEHSFYQQTVRPTYIDRGHAEFAGDDQGGARDHEEDDDDENNSSDEHGECAWPPTIVPLNDDDARSLTSQKVIAQLLSQHGSAPARQLPRPAPGSQATYESFLAPQPPRAPASVNRLAPFSASRPPAAESATYRSTAEITESRPPASPQCSPQSGASTPRFQQSYAPRENPLPFQALTRPPSFGLPAPVTRPFTGPLSSNVVPAPPQPIITSRGVTITTLGNAVSPAARLQVYPPTNGSFRSQHIVQGGLQPPPSPPYQTTHPRLVVTDRALAGQNQRVVRAKETGFWESPIQRGGGGACGADYPTEVKTGLPQTAAARARNETGFCHSKFLDTIHRWFGAG